MVWVKLDDTLAGHPKVDRLLDADELRGLAAVGLWALGLSKAGQQLTDGALTTRAVLSIAPEHAVDLAGELVAAGLWERSESGWQIHDYLDHNPTREEVLARREKDAARKAEARAAAAARRESTRTSKPTSKRMSERTSDRTGSDVHADVREESARPSALPDPTRPDPTLEDGASAPSAGARAGRTRKRTTVDQNRLPDDLAPNLAELAPSLLARLQALHAERGGRVPTLRGVGLALRQHPDRDHAHVLGELEHWALAGKGQTIPRDDWVATYRTFLGHSPAATPPKTVGTAVGRPRPMSAKEQRQADDLAALERLRTRTEAA